MGLTFHTILSRSYSFLIFQSEIFDKIELFFICFLHNLRFYEKVFVLN